MCTVDWHLPFTAAAPTQLLDIYMGQAWLQQRAEAMQLHLEAELQQAVAKQDALETQMAEFLDQQQQAAAEAEASKASNAKRIAEAEARQARAQEQIKSHGTKRKVPEPPGSPPPDKLYETQEEEGEE